MISNKKNEEDPNGKILDVCVSNLKTKHFYIIVCQRLKGQILSEPKLRHMGNMMEKRREQSAVGSQMLASRAEQLWDGY